MRPTDILVERGKAIASEAAQLLFHDDLMASLLEQPAQWC